MASITRFVSKAERIEAAKAEEARQVVLDLGLPASAQEDILITIQRHETGGQLAKWNFNMISPAQCLVVWNAIRGGDRPQETRAVFDYALTHLEINTGIVTLTREEIAECVGVRPQEVSTAMGRLEELGAIVRERVKVPGMKGRGKARYRINPHVGWNGSLDRRHLRAEEDQPPLPFKVIDGGTPAA